MPKVLWKLFHIDVIIPKFVCINSFSRAVGVNKLAEIVQTFAAYKTLMSCPFPQRALARNVVDKYLFGTWYNVYFSFFFA